MCTRYGSTWRTQLSFKCRYLCYLYKRTSFILQAMKCSVVHYCGVQQNGPARKSLELRVPV